MVLILLQARSLNGIGITTVIVGRDDELDPVTLVILFFLVHNLGRSAVVIFAFADLIDVVGVLVAVGLNRLLTIIVQVLGIQGTRNRRVDDCAVA